MGTIFTEQKSRNWAGQLRRGGEAAGGVQVDERWAKSFGLMLWIRVIIRKSIMVEYSDEEVWLARVPLWNYTVHELAFWSTGFFRSSFRVARSHTTSIDLTESLLTSKYLMWAGGKDQEFPRLIFLKNLIVCISMKMPVGLQAESCPDTTNMESLYRAPFLVLECPNLKLREAALGAHALGHDGVRCGGGVFLPYRRRNNLWCPCWTSRRWLYDWSMSIRHQ